MKKFMCLILSLMVVLTCQLSYCQDYLGLNVGGKGKQSNIGITYLKVDNKLIYGTSLSYFLPYITKKYFPNYNNICYGTGISLLVGRKVNNNFSIITEIGINKFKHKQLEGFYYNGKSISPVYSKTIDYSKDFGISIGWESNKKHKMALIGITKDKGVQCRFMFKF